MNQAGMNMTQSDFLSGKPLKLFFNETQTSILEINRKLRKWLREFTKNLNSLEKESCQKYNWNVSRKLWKLEFKIKKR